MSVGITIDTREFKAAAEALWLKSSRTFPGFVNGQMLKVASEAIKATDKADRQSIERELGAFGKDSGGKSFRIKKSDWARLEGTFAAKIVNARLRARGEKTIWGRALGAAALKLIAAKKRSVAFIKSGWIPALRDLSTLAYSSGGRAQDRAGFYDAKQFGQAKGSVMPAQYSEGGRVGCTIINSALLTVSRHSVGGKPGNPMPIARSGLEHGIRAATRDMIEELKRRLVKELGPIAS